MGNSMNRGRRSDLQMQLERLQSMERQPVNVDTSRKLVNVLGLDQADSDGGDLNDRSESTDPIEEFLRDIQAEVGEDDDDDERKEAEI